MIRIIVAKQKYYWSTVKYDIDKELNCIIQIISEKKNCSQMNPFGYWLLDCSVVFEKLLKTF